MESIGRFQDFRNRERIGQYKIMNRRGHQNETSEIMSIKTDQIKPSLRNEMKQLDFDVSPPVSDINLHQTCCFIN